MNTTDFAEFEEWTGVQVRLLRRVRRMSVRQFARHLGVSDRAVSMWEAGGASVRPRPVNQAILDESLRRCSAVERHRFDAALTGMPDDSRPPRSPIRWALIVDLPAADVELAAAIASAVRSVVLARSDNRGAGPPPATAGASDRLDGPPSRM